MSVTCASMSEPPARMRKVGIEIDDVGDLAELGQLGADLERDSRQPVA